MFKRLLKAVAKATGLVKQDKDTGIPVKARKKRLALSVLVVAVLVDQGMGTGLAAALVAFLETLVF